MSILRRRRRVRWVDPDLYGKRLELRCSANESFRVLRPCRSQNAFALLEDALGTAVMDVIGGEHRNSAMTVLGVVPGEECPAERGRGGDVGEAPGEAGMVLQGLELGLGEGVIVADVGSAQRAGDTEVGEQLCWSWVRRGPNAG